jgi:hypothetical protein
MTTKRTNLAILTFFSLTFSDWQLSKSLYFNIYILHFLVKFLPIKQMKMGEYRSLIPTTRLFKK